MAVGDVTVELVENATTSSVDTAITSIRSAVGSSYKWDTVSINNGQDVLIMFIEEA